MAQRPVEPVLSRNDLVELEVETPRGRRSCPAQVRELQGGVVTVALLEGFPEWVVEGPSGRQVRLIRATENAALALKARHLETVVAPVPLLILEREGTWERVQRRKDVRLPIVIEVQEAALLVGEGEEPKPISAMILDISAGGLLIHSRLPMPEGALLRIKFQLPKLPPPIEAEVEVVKSTAARGLLGEYHRARARFIGLPRRERGRILRFILQEQARRRMLER